MVHHLQSRPLYLYIWFETDMQIVLSGYSQEPIMTGCYNMLNGSSIVSYTGVSLFCILLCFTISLYSLAFVVVCYLVNSSVIPFHSLLIYTMFDTWTDIKKIQKSLPKIISALESLPTTTKRDPTQVSILNDSRLSFLIQYQRYISKPESPLSALPSFIEVFANIKMRYYTPPEKSLFANASMAQLVEYFLTTLVIHVQRGQQSQCHRASATTGRAAAHSPSVTVGWDDERDPLPAALLQRPHRRGLHHAAHGLPYQPRRAPEHPRLPGPSHATPPCPLPESRSLVCYSCTLISPTQ